LSTTRARSPVASRGAVLVRSGGAATATDMIEDSSRKGFLEGDFSSPMWSLKLRVLRAAAGAHNLLTSANDVNHDQRHRFALVGDADTRPASLARTTRVLRPRDSQPAMAARSQREGSLIESSRPSVRSAALNAGIGDRSPRELSRSSTPAHDVQDGRSRRRARPPGAKRSDGMHCACAPR
jgi:hypothetical protein